MRFHLDRERISLLLEVDLDYAVRSFAESIDCADSPILFTPKNESSVDPATSYFLEEMGYFPTESLLWGWLRFSVWLNDHQRTLLPEVCRRWNLAKEQARIPSQEMVGLITDWAEQMELLSRGTSSEELAVVLLRLGRDRICVPDGGGRFCVAKTKGGTSCLRRAKPDIFHCWQHLRQLKHNSLNRSFEDDDFDPLHVDAPW